MKELKKALLDKAKMHLSEEDYNKLAEYIKYEAWNNLRVFLSDLSDMSEIRSMLEDDRLEEWLAIDEMNNIAIEIAIQMIERADEGIVRSRRKRISRRPEVIV